MANIQSQEIRYSGGGADMQGYIAWDADRAGPRPGLAPAEGPLSGRAGAT